jgi:multidrug resistance efflux pump
VKKVCAQANQPLKKGDLLLEIDPAPYQYAVSQLEAQLAGARDAVKQKQAALEASEANVAKAVSQAEAGVTQAQAAQQQAEAGLGGARSAQLQAEAAARQAAFTLQVAQSNVPAVQAQLDDARFNLAQCRMTAPADGYVVDWQVHEGTMLVPRPMSAAGTFISTSENAVVASLPQNYLTNVAPGNDVEVVLDPYPGRLFHGKVESVITATGEGQFAPSGQIPSAAKVGSAGLLAVKIRLTDPGDPTALPLGAGGTVAIYTDYGKPVHIISKDPHEDVAALRAAVLGYLRARSSSPAGRPAAATRPSGSGGLNKRSEAISRFADQATPTLLSGGVISCSSGESRRKMPDARPRVWPHAS